MNAHKRPCGLLWVAVPVNLRHPTSLFSAASGADVGAWRQANPWADSVELCLLQAEGEGDVSAIGTPFAEPHPDVPWRVHNPPRRFPKRAAMEAKYAAAGISGEQSFNNAIARYRIACRHIALHALGDERTPTWTVLAGADDGILAVELASVFGRHVAVADSPPSPAAISIAIERNVSISIMQRSDDKRRSAADDLERLKWH